jgi:peptidoglycan/LPS O-acetylase OafA/YrhL
MAGPDARRAYRTLDGLRGVGAFLVVMRHVPMFFGPIRVPESFLAVDLFYLVSGFVVAHAYGERLRAGASFWGFVKTRIIRLYPLYLVGLALGTVSAVYAITVDPKGWWTPLKLVEAITTGLVLIPMFPGLGASGSALDGPVWTLLPELVANFVYAGFIKLMKNWVVIGIMLISAAAITYGELRFHTLDIGYNPTDQWAALARVGYSFFAGVLMFRLSKGREQLLPWMSWACMIFLTVLLAWRPAKGEVAWFELGTVLLVFPALLLIGSRFEPGPKVGAFFAHIGLVSYAIYLIHQPIGHILQPFLHGKFALPHGWPDVIFGAAFIVALVFIASWLDRFYDAPVRAWLRKRFLSTPG